VSDDKEPSDPQIRKITVWNLIQHTSGWDYSGATPNALNDWVFHIKEIGRGMGLHAPPTKEEFAQFMFNVDLNFNPGERRAYSNIGYLLLGMVIEKVSRQSYLDFLKDTLLRPLDINNVFVGATRLAGRLDNEVTYEDPYSGPDATLDPFDRTPAPLPYGGFDGMTELMDSGGGLITSADSLSHFISNYSVIGEGITVGESIVSTLGRHTGRRDGGMPGTSSVSKCFDGKNGLPGFDFAFIFNQYDKSTKVGEATGKLDDFVAGLESIVRSKFGG
jgi:CubicO group peptidase (beta-lactamase class C family)